MKNYQKNLYMNDIMKAIDEFSMINNGDKILVGLSGGKDSLLLCLALSMLKKYKIYDFDFTLIHVDAGYRSDFGKVEELFKEHNIDLIIERTNINEMIDLDNRKSVCYRCARMRKGVIKRICEEKGYNKIAFGHHKDDFVETFYMNLIYGGKLKTIKPVRLDEESGVSIIRPLMYCEEKNIIKASEIEALPIIKSSCPYNEKTKREEIKELVKRLSFDYKDILDKTMIASKSLF